MGKGRSVAPSSPVKLFFLQSQLLKQEITSLAAAAGLVLVLRDAGERPEGTGTHASGLQAMFDPLIAAVALDHLAVGGPVARRTEGASHGTALAADAVGVVIDGKAGFRILAEAAHRASRNAGGVRAVHACS